MSADRPGHRITTASRVEDPPGETAKNETSYSTVCLTREISEELGIQISEPRPFFMVDHRYATFYIRLCALKASIILGELLPRDHEEVKWVLRGQLPTMDLAPADGGIGEAIKETS